MDKLIRRWDGEVDADLVLCEKRGVAYQRKMSVGRVSYGGHYLEKVRAYEGTPIAKAVNAGRLAMLARFLPMKKSATVWSKVLDVGCGTGAFVREAVAAGFEARGYEVMEDAAIPLRLANLFSEETAYYFDAITAWDSLEHMENPGKRLEDMRKGGLLLASIPIFDDLRKIRESKHYRPGEHLYYWTKDGFVAWAALYGLRLLEFSNHEVKAGRESIGAFAFVKDLPDYNDHIQAYDYMHSHQHYGSSSAELFLTEIAELVRRKAPTSILDYGCGRSDLVAHFWLDGARKIARYDPAIPRFKDMPEGEFDLVLCCDVMEHIPMASVERVLREVLAKGKASVFTISTKLARAKLPDGRNAHVTLLSSGEWTRWISDIFGKTYLFPSKWEHELIVCAGMEEPAKGDVCRSCGGEMALDSYQRPTAKRLVTEWFMRCRKCGALGPSSLREEEARQAWRASNARVVA